MPPPTYKVDPARASRYMERVVEDAWIPAEAVVRFSIIEYNTTRVDEMVKISDPP